MLKKIFLDGLKAVIPVALILALVVWVLHGIELFFGTIIKKLFGSQHYFTGLGLIVGFVVVLCAGILVNAWFLRRIHQLFERIIERIPIIKTLYTAMRDFLDFFGKKKKPVGGRVVMVNVQGVRFLGMVIRDDFEGLPQGLGREHELSIYVPMSYNIGGFTINIPASYVETIDWPVDKAMSYVISAGMAGSEISGADGKKNAKA